jgi:energy-coupling factor transport system substrate-specific component
MIPITVIGGSNLIGHHSYMLDSMVILIYTMIPFFMVFERRKPKAREIVLIAMMSALTAVVHMMFHFTVPIQAGTALVIVSGIALGPEAGFLIGALARFVCNFYLTQGAWTPWQMFCWGILGFLAGLAFNKVDLDQLKSRSFKMVMGPVMCILFSILAAYVCYQIWPGEDTSFLGWRLYAFGLAGLFVGMLLQRKRLPVDGITLTMFTFFATFIIYGGVMNICALITSASLPGGQAITLESMRVLYLSGAPYDLYHAFTASLCVFLFGNSMIQKLERIKIKYGIYK